jgi:hypothetical protein
MPSRVIPFWLVLPPKQTQIAIFQFFFSLHYCCDPDCSLSYPNPPQVATWPALMHRQDTRPKQSKFAHTYGFKPCQHLELYSRLVQLSTGLLLKLHHTTQHDITRSLLCPAPHIGLQTQHNHGTIFHMSKSVEPMPTSYPQTLPPSNTPVIA